jgi:uncharacterized protein YndB with AHSA1/START domain
VIVAVLASNGSSRSGTELPKYTLDFWAGACLGDLSMKQGGIEHYRRCMQPTQAGVLMVELHVERTIGASPERTFDWLTDPVNLTTAPLFLRAGWAKGFSGPSVGAMREVTAVGAWLREEITAYDAPRSYSYLVVRSFPAAEHEGGTLTFTPSDGGTHVEWVSPYTIPARWGGKVTEAVTAPLFRWSFHAILAGCAKALES